MKILVVIAHPNTNQSFNHAIADQVCKTLSLENHDLIVRDLYAEHFDPVLPLNEEKLTIEELPQVIQDNIADVRAADGLIFIHPNWWGTPPAILKGWIDRILRAGFAYKFSENGVVQLLNDKIVQVFTTSNTPQDIELNVYHDPLENFWRNVVFGLCGAKSFERRNFEPIILSTEEIRASWLQEVGATIQRRFLA